MSDRAFERMLREEAKEKERSKKEKRRDKRIRLDKALFRLEGKRGNWQDHGDDIKSGEEV